ncbi:sel1 repeat family protein [Streptomyces sp. NPDC057011]|uniref:sel1 repeat family protein n=1 Tax=unclassified Streptomyces TaxID=2593676 RepID=UPI0036410209
MTFTVPQQERDPEQSFLQALRALGDWHGAHRERLPSVRALARHLNASPTTVGKWLEGAQAPQQPERLLELIGHLSSCAAAAGIALPDPPDLLDADAWRQRQAALHAHRTHTVREGVRRAQSAAALGQEELRARAAALPDKPRPLDQWTAAQLGVHAAVAGGAAVTAGFVLPAYVDRPHDAELRAHLASAADGADSVMVVVRGPSCAGKTRTAYEAVKRTLPDWRLVFPKGADSLLALLAADALGPRTVLWMNEAQEFLLGPAGEAAAAALRRRLEQPGPVVVMATLWPEYHQTLTSGPLSHAEDPHPHARALLTAVAAVDVPPEFTAEALTRLRVSDDPSLRVAGRTSVGARVTQTLAAGPQLIAHWQHPAGPAGRYGSALITAAMDARRLGCTSALPLALLEEAAPGYLNSQERAAASDDWFTDALAYARTKVKGVAAALEHVPRPTGMGALPGVCTLADYLDHHARSSRRFQVPPDSFWDAVLHHAQSISTQDLLALAGAAEDRWRLRRAFQLYEQAAEGGGSSRALTALARLRQQTKNHEEVERLYQRAADAGDPAALIVAAKRAKKIGAPLEAARLYRLAADAGSSQAWEELVLLELQENGVAGAEDVARQAAGAGHPEAVDCLLGPDTPLDADTTAHLMQIAADTGRHQLQRELARRWHEEGYPAEAERLYRIAVDAGSTLALRDLSLLCEEAGRHDEAEDLALQAAVVSQVFQGGLSRDERPRWPAGRGPLQELARSRADAGDLEEAERLYEVAAETGDPDALRYIARRREDDGELEEAAQLYRRAAEARNAHLRRRLLPFIKDAALRQELAHVFQQRSMQPQALRDLAMMEERAGNMHEAERLHQLAGGQTHQLLRLRIEAKQWQQAEDIAAELARAGDTSPLCILAFAFEKEGEEDRAAHLYQQASDAGDTMAAAPLVRLMRRTWGPSHPRSVDKPSHGRPPSPEQLVMAEHLARRNADAGESSLLHQLGRRKDVGPDIEQLYQYGLEADGTISLPW